MDTGNVWFITGASKGLGLSLVKQLLAQGQFVAATSRTLDDLRQAVGTTDDRFLPVAADVTNEDSVADAVRAAVAQFGRIDVVVNNAGYGLLGGLEELTDREARANFDVNVFGSLNVIRHVMPQLRQQRAGYIINISSIAGFSGAFAGWGIYCATKFALEGLSEALSAEASAFGIRVTVVEPGYFRTSFLTSGSLLVSERQIDAYESVHQSQQVHQMQINGNQPGDPEKAVAALVRMADEPNPPLHLFLGQDAYDMANEKIRAVQRDLETWKSVITNTGFDVPATSPSLT